MRKSVKWLLAFAALTGVIAISSEPILARGGAANIMNSPGYQRRLQESRQQVAPPSVQASSAHRHTSRHRHHH